MRLFDRKRKVEEKALVSSGSGRLWEPIFEAFQGAFQRGISSDHDDALKHGPVYACVNRIATDISIPTLELLQKVETDDGFIRVRLKISTRFDQLFKNGPNLYQTWPQFMRTWMVSKLRRGNTMILVRRNESGYVNELHVLEPTMVQVLVTDGGEVFYRLSRDDLAQVEDNSIVIPSSDIIHDRMVEGYHPLYGLSPLQALRQEVYAGTEIRKTQSKFFENEARPSGILTPVTNISEEAAKKATENFKKASSGNRKGSLVFLPVEFKYQSLSLTAEDAQVIEQFKLTAEAICSAFSVPAFMVGYGEQPGFDTAAEAAQQYFKTTIQGHLVHIERLLEWKLSLPKNLCVRFRTEDLLRMNEKEEIETLKEGVLGGIYSPDYARFRRNQPAVPGGDTPYLQQQNFSLGALARRDAQEDPFRHANGPPPAPAALPAPKKGTKQRVIDPAVLSRKLEEALA